MMKYLEYLKLDAIYLKAKFMSFKEIENENWSLYAIIQLTVMEDCPVKTKFLKRI